MQKLVQGSINFATKVPIYLQSILLLWIFYILILAINQINLHVNQYFD